MAKVEATLLRIGKRKLITVNAGIHFAPEVKAVAAVGLGLAGYIWLASPSGHDSGTGVASASQTGISSTVPDVPNRRNFPKVPEVFQPGTHHLQVTSGFSADEIALGDIALSRVYNDGKPTASWGGKFHQRFTIFPNGQPVDDPYVKGLKCELVNAGVKTLRSNPPEMICGPSSQFEHHGGKSNKSRQTTTMARRTTRTPRYQYRRV